MNRPNFSKTTRHVITALIVVLGGSALFYFDLLWPEIILVVGLAIALKQFLAGAIFDPLASLVIFGCMYISVKMNMGWEILIPLPALIFVIGVFILLHEYFLRKEQLEDSIDPDDF